MRKLKLQSMSAAVLVSSLLLMSGCSSGDEAAEESSAPILQGSLTTAAPWVVLLETPGSWCSASVLTEHWLLTSAHCVKQYKGFSVQTKVFWANVPGGREVLYDGLSRPYAHGTYDGDGDSEYDIALVKLEQPLGIDLSKTGRAKLWALSTPWASSSTEGRSFVGIGWGNTGMEECQDGTAGQKRFTSALVLAKAAPDALDVRTPVGWSVHCSGDSGSPWLFKRGLHFIAFAVESYYLSDLVFWGANDHAPLIPPKGQWMSQTARAAGLELTCSLAGNVGDGSFVECTERPAPPPPPGSGCATGSRCCEATPTGCRQCVRPPQVCP